MPLVTTDDLKVAAPDTIDLIGEAQTLHNKYHSYLAKLGDKGPVRSQGIHASEISRCYRQAVYTLRGEDKFFDENKDQEVKAFWKKTFDHGTYVHRMIQDHFEDLAAVYKNDVRYITFEEEVKLNPSTQELAKKWNIYSSCDGLFTFFDNNDGVPCLRVGVEIKTKKSTEFDKLKEPEPAHIEQAHVYMAVLDVPLFWMLYFNKDNQNITPAEPPWLLRFDERLWGKLEQRFQMFHDHFEEGTLPEQMPGSHCGFCPYKWSCNPPTKKTFMPRPALRRP